MKLLRSGFLCSMFLSAAWVNADPIRPSDPTIIIDTDVGLSTEIFALTFEFMANEHGGGFLEFINKSVDWFNLLITTELPAGTTFPDDYFFGGTAYTNVEATLDTATNLLSILFFDADSSGTILNNQTFTINLNNPYSTVGGWGANHAFSAQANTPEPATLLLVLSGLGILLGSRTLGGRFGRGG